MAQTEKSNRIEMDLNTAVEVAIEMSNIKSSNMNIPYIVGSPGIGKTRMIESVIRGKNYGLMALTPGLERQEKFGGIPEMIYKDMNVKSKSGEMIKEKELHTIWSVPEMVAQARIQASEYEKFFILLDDWHLAPAAIQAIGFELFTHRSLSGAKLPNNIHFILAGNETSAAGAKTQLTAIRNRTKVLFAVPNVNYWIENFALPNNLHEAGISFFERVENKTLFNMEEQTSKQFGTARSWTSAFESLRHFEKIYNDRKSEIILQAILAGDVGEEACAKFWTYYKIYRSQDIAKVFETGQYQIPEDPVNRFAFGAALSAEFYNTIAGLFASKNKADSKTKINKISKIFVQILNDLHKNKYREIAAMTLKSIANKPANEEYKLPSGLDLLATIGTEYNIDMNGAYKDMAAVKTRLNTIKLD